VSVLQGLSEEPLMPLLGVEAAQDRRRRNQEGRNREQPRARRPVGSPSPARADDGPAVQIPAASDDRPLQSLASRPDVQASPEGPPSPGSCLDIRI